MDSTSSTQNGPFVTEYQHHYSFPISLDLLFVKNPDGSYTQTTSVDQQYQKTFAESFDGTKKYSDATSEQVQSSDVLQISSGFSISGYGPASSSANYVSTNSYGECYSSKLASANSVLTGAVYNTECPATAPK